MQRTTPTSATTPTFPTFSTAFFGSAGTSRPSTRDGNNVDPLHHQPPQSPPPPVPTAAKETRKSSFSRKNPLTGGSRRRGSSVGSSGTSNAIVTDAAAPPALPDYALPAAAKVQSRERRDGAGGGDHVVRSPVSPDGGFFGSLPARPTTSSGNATAFLPPATPFMSAGSSVWQPSEASVIHQQITDVASKRISTLDYLRKACVSHLLSL